MFAASDLSKFSKISEIRIPYLPEFSPESRKGTRQFRGGQSYCRLLRLSSANFYPGLPKSGRKGESGSGLRSTWVLCVGVDRRFFINIYGTLFIYSSNFSIEITRGSGPETIIY